LRVVGKLCSFNNFLKVSTILYLNFMEWYSDDRTIGLYGSTHLPQEVPEVERFLHRLDPMLVMVETDDEKGTRPDMQTAIDFARSKQRQVAYIGFNIGDVVRELGRTYPLHTAIHFGIITCHEQIQNVASEEDLRGRVQFVLYNVVEDMNPTQKIKILQEAIVYMDRHIAETWKERERFGTQQFMQEAKRGIEEREVEEPISGFRQYSEEFDRYTAEKLWGNISTALGYPLNPKGIIVGQWHFPHMQQRLHYFTRS